MTIYRFVQPITALFRSLNGLNTYKWRKAEMTEERRVVAFVSPIKWDGIVIEPMNGQTDAQTLQD